MTKPRCRLYLITPPEMPSPQDFAAVLAEALDGGDVACVQLRLKGVEDDALRRAIDVLRPIAQTKGAAFLLNDRPDLAAQTGCDGVHIGQDDTPYNSARAIIGPDAIIGVTCHDSRHLAMEAAERGADYVAFGAFYPTETKTPKATAEPDILTWWQDLMEIPCVAVGGITVANAPALVEAGADFIAVCGGVWGYEKGPKAAVAAFNGVF